MEIPLLFERLGRKSRKGQLPANKNLSRIKYWEVPSKKGISETASHIHVRGEEKTDLRWGNPPRYLKPSTCEGKHFLCPFREVLSSKHFYRMLLECRPLSQSALIPFIGPFVAAEGRVIYF